MDNDTEIFVFVEIFQGMNKLFLNIHANRNSATDLQSKCWLLTPWNFDALAFISTVKQCFIILSEHSNNI